MFLVTNYSEGNIFCTQPSKLFSNIQSNFFSFVNFINVVNLIVYRNNNYLYYYESLSHPESIKYWFCVCIFLYDNTIYC